MRMLNVVSSRQRASLGARLVAVARLTGAASPQSAGQAASPTLIIGKIVGAATLAPLPGVGVRVLGGASLGATDQDGELHVSLPVRGIVTLVLRPLGYGAVGISLELVPMGEDAFCGVVAVWTK